ncbi:hypothetical protein LXA43DRAFT_1097231 [Ganoderma leucocontextum]|nr:hypothetical protein LXA43DRAFT_1097231 [Ganoderma leucocontextum]
MFWDLSTEKTGDDSLVGTTANVYGSLDQAQNHIRYPDNKWDNIKNNMGQGSGSSTTVTGTPTSTSTTSTSTTSTTTTSTSTTSVSTTSTSTSATTTPMSGSGSCSGVAAWNSQSVYVGGQSAAYKGDSEDDDDDDEGDGEDDDGESKSYAWDAVDTDQRDLPEDTDVLVTKEGMQQMTKDRRAEFKTATAKLKDLMDTFETLHGFSGVFALLGNVPNSDSELVEVHETKDAIGFFEARCRADKDEMFTHLKAHIYNNVSLSLVNRNFGEMPPQHCGTAKSHLANVVGKSKHQTNAAPGTSEEGPSKQTQINVVRRHVMHFSDMPSKHQHMAQWVTNGLLRRLDELQIPEIPSWKTFPSMEDDAEPRALGVGRPVDHPMSLPSDVPSAVQRLLPSDVPSAAQRLLPSVVPLP